MPLLRRKLHLVCEIPIQLSCTRIKAPGQELPAVDPDHGRDLGEMRRHAVDHRYHRLDETVALLDRPDLDPLAEAAARHGIAVILVTHLTKARETSPLIFDDVTVQTDSPRTTAILDLLHEISAQRQVILFSQEEDVRRWAEKCLAERDRMEVLGDPVATA